MKVPTIKHLEAAGKDAGKVLDNMEDDLVRARDASMERFDSHAVVLLTRRIDRLRDRRARFFSEAA